ncbi:MAG: hypothetical protein ABIA62_04100 [Candidatus Woesearchaeota archaeon]
MFEPNLRYRFDYTGIGNRLFDNNYDLIVKKDFAEYVVFDNKRIENVSKGAHFPVGGYIEFPEKIDPPGKHNMLICVLEDCPEGGMVCGRGSACASLEFMVLHPGIMPQITFAAPDVNQDELIDFTVNIENVGEEDIQQASGTIDVFNVDDVLLGSATLDTKDIPSNSPAVLSGKFDTKGLLPGNYSAKAHITTDSITNDLEDSFRIGTLDVKILSYTRELESGSIKLFETKIESSWNDPIDVYANIKIFDSDTNIEAKSVTEALLPWKTQSINAFIDTSGLEEKQYDIRVEIFYAEKSSFVEGKINIVSAPDTAAKPSEQEIAQTQGLGTSTLTFLLVVVVLLLTGINIFLAVYKKKK